MARYRKVIFLDRDDTARAPMAEYIMRSKHLLKPMEICSRGLVVLFPEPMNQKAEAVLISNGHRPEEFQAPQLKQEDIADDVLILTMEDEQKGKIWTTYANAPNVYTLSGYVGLSGDIPPLYGGALTAYGRCYEALDTLISKLILKFNEEELLK